MARKPRIEYAGAVYHVMRRGDHGEAIFQDDQDRVRMMQASPPQTPGRLSIPGWASPQVTSRPLQHLSLLSPTQFGEEFLGSFQDVHDRATGLRNNRLHARIRARTKLALKEPPFVKAHASGP